MKGEMLLRVEYQKWGHDPEVLRLFALEAPHPRTRERFLALYEVSQGRSATQVAQGTGRHDQTIHKWIHLYNHRGEAALIYRRTGGRPPFVLRSKRI
jgi:transposase